ncbi:MAG: cyclohexanecarboxylate-CoA ligase [Candidatus Rokuibacteriota bacterium]|nr:MAG: cyclohexanecarboxylate-CoA ligase [Candidatus Rokubacteria bacterium]
MGFETRLTDELIARYQQAGHWGSETFYAILARRAKTYPDRVAIVDRGRRVTYGELKTRIDRVAAGLDALGIEAGDVVTIQLPNWAEFAYVFFALERLGAVANQIGPDFRSREVDYILRFSESRAFVCPASFKGFDYVKMIGELRPGLPDLRAVCALGAAPDLATRGGLTTRGLVSLDALLEDADAVVPRGAGQGANDIMRMAFTSGTTGNPKGVIHSHNTTLSTCRTLNNDMRVTEDEVFLVYLPLGLNWGYLTLVQSVMAGARVVLLDQFGARAALELIQRERVTCIPTAPASIIAMLNEPELGRFDFSSLRVVITGGASCPVETIREFRARLHGQLIELYGMLETGFHTYTRLSDDPEAVTGTVGKVSSGLGLRLIDESGRDVPVGAEGEIAAEGPSVHLGYHKNPQANAALFTADGWFRTGDLGQLDAAGNVRIVGRLKEMINRGGKKFFPREIEEILYTHPKILHAAIVGVPDPRLGERNCLCVIPRPGQALALDEVVAFLKDGVATYKLPETLEVFDDLPFTPTGKIQRHVLVRRVLERRGL